MYALTKRRVTEVRIELDEKDIELYEKHSFEFGSQIRKILEGVKGTKLNAFGYKKPEIHKFGTVSFGSVIAYWEGKETVIEQG